MKPYVTVLICSVLLACGTPKIPVQERWAESIRNYALVPVYPMREDLFVGDIRIHDVEGSPYAINSRLLGHVPVEEALESKEKELPTYGKSSSPPSPKADPPAVWSQPESSLRRDSPGNRLRLAALPKIDAVRVTSGDVSGGGLLGLLSIVGGAGLESEQTLVVSLSGIETVELVDTQAIPHFAAWLSKRLSATDGDTNFVYAVCANAQRFGENAVKNTRISMVTRALYARGIDYSYGDTFGGALRASAGVGGVITEPIVTPDGKEAAKQPQAPSVDLSKITPSAPGVSARITRASRDGLSMTEVYEMPLAFGADVIAVNPFNFESTLQERCEKFFPHIFERNTDISSAIILTAPPPSAKPSPLE